MRLVRHYLLRRLHDTRGLNRIHGQLMAGIGRAQQEATRAVGDEVGHAVSEWAAGDIREPAARRVDREAGDDLRLAAHADVEEPAIGTDCHRGRNTRLHDVGDGHALEYPQVTGLSLKLEHDDLIAFGIPNIDEAARMRGGCVCHRRHRREGNRTPDPKSDGFLPPWEADGPCHELCISLNSGLG